MTHTARFVMVAVCALLAVGPGVVVAVEEAKYSVLLQDDEFELRRYPPQIVAETLVTGAFDSVGNTGFKRLAGYIFGDNRSRNRVDMTAPVSQTPVSEKIAMTAPVNQQAVGQQIAGDQYRITFMMPAGSTLDSLPEPTDANVQLRELPVQWMAAVRYSGTWSESRYQQWQKSLQAWVQEQGWTPTGPPVFARYNPPFMPWFMRRNEVLLPLQPVETQDAG